ncbi:hypothetical protein AURDEDRAFT_112363 [Auricularia subglabra TFB-10046 SS5]|nr:hypothetical protein AURDEDRAFT_112363 [Auricularia subglabra TFB-10046 SS5]
MSTEETRSWTLTALQTLFMASTDETWTEAFAAAFAPDVSIRAAALGEGHVELTEHELANVVPGEGQRSEEHAGDDARALLERRIKATKLAHRSKVEWGSVSATSENDGRVIVQGLGTITRSMVFRLRAAPAQLKFDVYFRAEVANPSAPKISRYAQTVRGYKPPITLPHLPVQPPPKKQEL